MIEKCHFESNIIEVGHNPGDIGWITGAALALACHKLQGITRYPTTHDAHAMSSNNDNSSKILSSKTSFPQQHNDIQDDTDGYKRWVRDSVLMIHDSVFHGNRITQQSVASTRKIPTQLLGVNSLCSCTVHRQHICLAQSCDVVECRVLFPCAL
jgi:hypothetical protein